jgi:hypothetical protein
MNFDEATIFQKVQSFQKMEKWSRQILLFSTDEEDELVLPSPNTQEPKNIFFKFIEGIHLNIKPNSFFQRLIETKTQVKNFQILQNTKNNQNLYFLKLQIDHNNFLSHLKSLWVVSDIFQKYSKQYPFLNYLFEPWDSLIQIYPDNTFSARLRAPIIRGSIRCHSELKYNHYLFPYYSVENLLEMKNANALLQLVYLYMPTKSNVGLTGNLRILDNVDYKLDVGGELFTKGNTVCFFFVHLSGTWFQIFLVERKSTIIEFHLQI